MSFSSDFKIYPHWGSTSGNKPITEGITYTGTVVKVFLNYDKPENPNQYPPGTIEVLPLQPGAKKIAYPYEPSLITLPVEGETVEIFIKSDLHFYRRKGYNGNTNNSIIFDKAVGAGSKPLPDIGLADYKTGVGGTNSTSTETKTGNNKFKKQIPTLKYYSGDTLIQSRFGQSLRFSGYNNEFGEEHPTIMLRNRAFIDPNNKSGIINEDINKDGSTIAITSGKYKSKFLPGIIDKSGKSNFVLKVWQNNPKYAFESYPTELSGDQIVITSGRLIFSSRSEETIFFSKGWFGIVTDSALSIDAQRGVTIVAHKGNIDFESKEGVINFNAGKAGVMHIGSGNGKELAPVIDGKGLTELIGKLCDIIQQIGFAGVITPCGPTTGMNPAVITDLAEVRSKLPGLLSNTVWIAK